MIRLKQSTFEKFDGFIPRGETFIQNGNSKVCKQEDSFSMTRAYSWNPKFRRRSYSYGVSKRIFWASQDAIMVDSSHVGKSDSDV